MTEHKQTNDLEAIARSQVARVRPKAAPGKGCCREHYSRVRFAYPSYAAVFEPDRRRVREAKRNAPSRDSNSGPRDA